MSRISSEPTTSFCGLTKATVCPGFSDFACPSSTGNDSGMVQAYFLPSWTITSSSRTRLNVSRSIGPVSGLSPPSPRRYSVERSASLTARRGSDAVRARKSTASSAGTLRLTGSFSPPCGGIKSDIAKLSLNLIRQGVIFLNTADQLRQSNALQSALFLRLYFLPDGEQDTDDGRMASLGEGRARRGGTIVDGVDDVRQRNRLRRTCQLIAAGCAAHANDQARRL